MVCSKFTLYEPHGNDAHFNCIWIRQIYCDGDKPGSLYHQKSNCSLLQYLPSPGHAPPWPPTLTPVSTATSKAQAHLQC